MPQLGPTNTPSLDPSKDLQPLNGDPVAGGNTSSLSSGQSISQGGYVSPYANQSQQGNSNQMQDKQNTVNQPLQAPQNQSSQTSMPAQSQQVQLSQAQQQNSFQPPQSFPTQSLPNVQLGQSQQTPPSMEDVLNSQQPPINSNMSPIPQTTQPQLPQQENLSQISPIQQTPPSQQTPPIQQTPPSQPMQTNFIDSGANNFVANNNFSSVDVNLKDSKGLNPDADLVVKQEKVDIDVANLSTPISTNRNSTASSPSSLEINPILELVVKKNASDMHLSAGYPIHLRIDGNLVKIGNAMSNQQVKALINKTLTASQRELLEVNKEVDLSYAYEDKARFRVNAYYEKGNLAAAYRLIPNRIKTMEELKLPAVIRDFTLTSQGLFLVTGPTGSGKSTTLAAMLNEINQTQPVHMITLEDPIEYVYPKGMALVDQREIGQDSHDWSIALKSILRQDPDTVLIGEMRDYQTIQAAITTAETGHLVFATLHTSSAAQSIDRIIDVFPPHQQGQIRSQLAVTLRGIISQRLVPIQGGGREAAFEILVVTPAVSNLIREGKTYQIDNVISTSMDLGMVMMERSLGDMIKSGKITLETAQEYTIRPDELLKQIKTS